MKKPPRYELDRNSYPGYNSFMKKCSICKIEKPRSEFNWKSKSCGKKHSACRICENKSKREKYATSKSTRKYYRDKAARRRRERQDKIVSWLNEQDLQCERCGASHPAVIVFHHRDPAQKKYNVAHIKGGAVSFEAFINEVEKCNVLCANCHRIHHYNERAQVNPLATNQSKG